MSSCISYEFFQSKLGIPGGLAILDKDGKIPLAQLPEIEGAVFKKELVKESNSEIKVPFKGKYITIDSLISSNKTGDIADYAYVVETKSYWYWNEGLSKWVNQNITETEYNLLKEGEKGSVPYIVGP